MPSPTLPFAHLNLRRNPFGELPRAEWAELAVADVESVVARLCTERYAVQYLGREGRGKTTHLLAIASHFPGAAFVYIGEGERPAIPRGRPLLIDEYQRLSPLRRWRVLRRRVPLAIASHEDVSEELARAGYRVETVRLDGRLNAAELWAMLNRRIERCRRGPGAVPRVSPPAASCLMERFGDDVRAIEWHLYHCIENLREPSDVEV